MITATAGFLSAATGAIVALNQTGVVDLKKMTGAKPAEQSTPATEQAAPGTAGAKPADARPAVDGSVATAVKKDEPAPATSRPAENPAPPSNPMPQPLPATKPIEPEKSVSKPVGEAKPATVPQEAPAVVKKPDPPVVPAPAPSTDKAPPPAPMPRDRVAETKSPEVKHAPPSSPPARPEPDRPGVRVEKKPAEATQPEVKKAPPPPDSKQPVPRPSPEERKADTKSPDRATRPPTSKGEEPEKPKIVRAPGDQVADRGKPNDKDVDREREPGKKKEASGRTEGRPTASGKGGQINLAGLQMSVPSEWYQSEPPSATNATLGIPDPAGACTVQISRMGAKGPEMEDSTIENWLGKLSKGNGAPMTRSDAKIQRQQHGPVRVTTVEFGGDSVKRIGLPALVDEKMIGAIIDHPAGAHKILISGPAKSMAKWDSAIDEFLKSVKPE